MEWVIVMNTNLPVTLIKGIGERKAKDLSSMQIHTINDLIHHYPRDYEEKKEISFINQIVPGDTYLIEGTVCSEPSNIRAKNLVITKMKVKDATGIIQVAWYRQPYLKNQYKIGQTLYLKGRVLMKMGNLQMEAPKVIKEEELERTKSQQLLPIYSTKASISSKMMNEWILNALEYTKGQLKDHIPLDIRQMYDLCEYNYALMQIHQPIDEHSLEIAKKRLIFDEFLLFQLGLQMLKRDCFVVSNDYVFSNDSVCKRLLDTLPYKLTNAQNRVWNEIVSDLKSNHTMNRLVQGDVGSGKTIIAGLALAFAAENGYQGTMMAPTEVLAKQHYDSLSQLLVPLGIKVGLLVGSMTKKQKETCYEAIETGEIQVIVGTHAIIQEGVHFNKLALVITDEQHRFGVRQRERLAGKGQKPHVIVMSATPIPRTLALILYGDMDVSVIDELPPGRKEIKTYCVDGSYRDRIYKFIEKEVEAGRQCYIVCPAIEDNEESDLQSVISYTEVLKASMPDTIRIEVLHGKMKPKDKNDIMEKFASHEIDVLVSTTVIEVGVNVPNATIMMIENADRFGLASLHQLRGRVGRGEFVSYCILVTDTKSNATKERLKVLESSNDGFVISEYDLKTRGPGDALGTLQHGIPQLRIGNLFQDTKLLKQTHELAKSILDEDKFLQSEKYKYLGEVSTQYFKENVEQISL